MQEVTLTFTDIWTDMTLKGLDRHFDVFNLLGKNKDTVNSSNPYDLTVHLNVGHVSAEDLLKDHPDLTLIFQSMSEVSILNAHSNVVPLMRCLMHSINMYDFDDVLKEMEEDSNLLYSHPALENTVFRELAKTVILLFLNKEGEKKLLREYYYARNYRSTTIAVPFAVFVEVLKEAAFNVLSDLKSYSIQKEMEKLEWEIERLNSENYFSTLVDSDYDDYDGADEDYDWEDKD